MTGVVAQPLGEVVKRTVSQESSTVTYYLRSRALGGKIINELDQTGVKRKGYVYAGKELLAEQVFTSVVWQHENPLTGSRGASYANGYYTLEGERDATGVNVGFLDPFLTCCVQPSSELFIADLFSDSESCGLNPNCVKCTFDGMTIANCDLAFSQLANGAAEINPRGTSPSAASKLGATPIYGRFCTIRISGGRIETDCEVEITGYTSSGLLSTSLNLRPLEPQNTGAIGKAQEALLKSPCVDFYTRVLNSPNVNTESNPVLEGGDLSEIFQHFLNQKKGGLTRKPIDGGAGSGSVKGLIRPGKSNSNGTIYLPTGPTDWHDAVGLVGEIFHLAGSKALYYDYELAVAVRDIPEFARKFSQDPNRNIFDERYEGGDPKDRYNGGYSTYFHDIARQLCSVRNGTVK